MGSFTTEQQRVFVGTLVFNIAFNTVCLLVAIHNTIMYVCRPRHRKFLINLFYVIIIASLGFKIFHDSFLLMNRHNIYY